MNSTPSFFSQMVDRFTSETPIFFKKIVAITATIGSLGLALKATDLTGLHLPYDLNQVSGYMIAIGGVGTIIAKLTTTNPNLQAQGGSNVIVNNEQTPPQSTEAPVSPVVPESK